MVGPRVIKLCTIELESVGRSSGSVYAFSTVGSVLGTLTLGFFLLPILGTRTILYGVSIGLLLLAVVLALYERALTIGQQSLGPDHVGVAPSLNGLGVIRREQGRYAEAERHFERALTIVEKALGAKHPNVAFVLNDLALLYSKQGKQAQAEPLYRRALAIREKVLGPEHPRVATSLENYAALLRATGRGNEATELEARAKAIRAKLAKQNPTK